MNGQNVKDSPRSTRRYRIVVARKNVITIWQRVFDARMAKKTHGKCQHNVHCLTYQQHVNQFESICLD